MANSICSACQHLEEWAAWMKNLFTNRTLFLAIGFVNLRKGDEDEWTFFKTFRLWFSLLSLSISWRLRSIYKDFPIKQDPSLWCWVCQPLEGWQAWMSFCYLFKIQAIFFNSSRWGIMQALSCAMAKIITVVLWIQKGTVIKKKN